MEIETGIPLPPKSVRRSPATKSALALELGQSMIVASEDEARACRQALKKVGRKIACRKLGEDGQQRIWRTE